MAGLQRLSQQLGYDFKDPVLLSMALRHRSSGSPHNERLEFLGDSVLGFVISDALYARLPEATEGDLSRLRASLVKGEVLAELAQTLKISDYLSLGLGERKSCETVRASILADAMEALFGAIYLDGGIVALERCVLKLYQNRMNNLQQLKAKKDAKSQLQEWLQSHKFTLPVYHVQMSGEAHNLTFHVVCSVAGLPYKTVGVSSSRRKAEQIAAQQFLGKINDD